MDCFNHIDRPAVGICKHCNKGLCPDCSTDTGAGIACTATRIEEVESVNRLIASNKKTMASQGSRTSLTDT